MKITYSEIQFVAITRKMVLFIAKQLVKEEMENVLV